MLRNLSEVQLSVYSLGHLCIKRDKCTRVPSLRKIKKIELVRFAIKEYEAADSRTQTSRHR